MNIRDRIIIKLTDAFQPDDLEVIDESHLHEGHAGHRPGGESHFRVRIVSPAFRNVSRVAVHRQVYDVLADEIAAGVHALAINASGPHDA